MQNPKKRRVFRSFRSQLILALAVISAIPLLIIQIYSFYRTTEIIEANTNELIEANIVSTLQSVSLTIGAYQNTLDQLYVDDTLVALVNKLNASDETALNTNQLIRLLRTACFAKEYIQGITVVQPDGSMVFYDKLTGSTIRNAWMIQNDIAPQSLFEEFSNDNKAHLLPTQYATQINNEKIYLFHVVRRIIDYRDIEKRPGIVILSLDERLLRETINGEQSSLGSSFLLGDNDEVISSPNPYYIGYELKDPLGDCIQMVARGQGKDSKSMKAFEQIEESIHWRLVCVVDQSEMMERIAEQQRAMLLILMLIILLLGTVIALVTGKLSRFIKKIAGAMQRAGTGDMQVRVIEDVRMPTEVAVIADQFNLMMGNIDQLIQQLKTVSQNKRDAEIAMLEAQINPHFLYNTLDSINWMAIDENQMEISGAITALARILRYSVDESNRLVPLREEVAWLKQYLFLQQVRLKSGFEYTLDVSEEVMDITIHKLLFQPFVENAVRHGFEGIKQQRKLMIRICREEDFLLTSVADNGRGMNEAQLAAIQRAIDRREEQPGHIGILNAVSRMRMYYGEAIHIEINSVPEEGTEVILRIPLDDSKE